MIRRFLNYRPHPIRALRRFVQRGFRGWSDEDVWDFDHYLAGVLAGGLWQLAEDSHGYPCRGTPPETCKTCDCESRWQHELKENALRFQLMHDDEWYGIEPLAESWKAETENYEQASAWLAKWFRALWN